MWFAYFNIFAQILAFSLIAVAAIRLYSVGSRLAGFFIGVPSALVAFASLMAELWGEWPKEPVYGAYGEFLWFSTQPNVWHQFLGYVSTICLLTIAIGLLVHARRISTLNK